MKYVCMRCYRCGRKGGVVGKGVWWGRGCGGMDTYSRVGIYLIFCAFRVGAYLKVGAYLNKYGI